MTEIKSTPEVDHSRPRLFFHATRSNEAVKLMPELGLLADKYTLTPTLELAWDFVDPGRGFLTFWYPNKQEVKGKDSAFLVPTPILAAKQKSEFEQKLLALDLDSYTKGYLIGLVGKSQTFLPAARLGAIAKADTEVVGELASVLPSDSEDILTKYTQQYAILYGNLLEILNETNITFFDPKLKREILATDLIRTSLEHGMLSLGRRLNQANKSNGSRDFLADENILDSVSFDDPVYERYRNMLLSAIERLNK